MHARHPFTARAAARQAHLRLLQTTDLHGHLLAYDYHADRPVATRGLARTAARIREARAGAPNTLLLDSGDFLQGSLLSETAAEAPVEAGPHPMIAAMNRLGYDAAALGNHDFEIGLAALGRVVAGARFPVLGANVVRKLGPAPTLDRPLFPPFALLDRRLVTGGGREVDVRIGVLGLLPPQVAQWEHRHLAGRAASRGIVECARAWVPEIRRAGAGIVIVLAHTGIGPAGEVAGAQDAAVPLGAIDGVDAVLAGHTHQVFPGPAHGGLDGVDAATGTISGVPAVMAGSYGSHLGVVDLLIDTARGGPRIGAHASAAWPIARRRPGGEPAALVAPEPEIVVRAAPHHAATLRRIRRPVGHTPHPLTTYFAMIGEDSALRLVAGAQAARTRAALAGTRHAGLPVLAAASPFRAGGRGGPENYTEVAAGGVALRDLADLCPVPNTLTALRLTGADVAEWLERAASLFNRMQPGVENAALLPAESALYNLDLIAGLSYRIDLSRPARYTAGGALADPATRRVTGLRLGGGALDPAAEVILATTGYRAGGGGAFPGAATAERALETRENIGDLVRARLRAGPGKARPRAPVWRFAPLTGTSAVFETGPGAARYLPQGPRRRVERLGPGADGFDRYRIRF